MIRIFSLVALCAVTTTGFVVGENQRAGPAEDVRVSSVDKYLGDAICESCHRETAESYHQTAHYFTSRLPSRDTILGAFTADGNTRTTSNPELEFRMTEKNGVFFQTAVQGMAPYTTERTERFAFVIGSGGKGQTYLFWKKDELFQLPVSYWRELGWVNSPGYKDGVANFDRPIIPRCLECHATYFQALPPPPNRYATSDFVLGIACEKCHGPGQDHLQHESSKHSASSDSSILNPAKFSRERQMDLCAWCHAGAGTPVVPSFSYSPGQPLGKYLELPAPDPGAEVDVHGSQVELLERSRCFKASSMTCSTCHNVHVSQHDQSVFSGRCLTCHKPGTAAFPEHHKIASDCIDCHMPMQKTNRIVFDLNRKQTRPEVRSHWIKVYSSATAANE